MLPGLFSTPQLRTDVEALGSGSLQRAEQIVLLIEFLQNLKAFCAFLQLRVSDKAQTRSGAPARYHVSSMLAS